MAWTERLYRRAPSWLQTGLFNGHALRVRNHRFGAAYRRELSKIDRRPRWAPARIAEYQAARVHHIVRVAYSGSHYYRDLFDDLGIHPEDLRTVGDLRQVPLLTKDLVRAHARELTTRHSPGRGWLHGHTSGTTGSPLSLWYDRRTCILTNAVDGRFKSWIGIGPDDWLGVILGRVVVTPHRARPPFWKVNWIQRQVWFSCFHMSDPLLGSYVAEIRRRDLRYLEGFPSTLFVLAQYLLRRGSTLPMRAVITSSETLHPLQREAIEAAFECPLFDFYAAAERVIHAGECEVHDGKHVSEDYGFLEVVNAHGDPVPDGDPGYLVGTSFHNEAMPLLRYRTDDIATIMPEPCSCGRTFRRISAVTTKAVDVVTTPSGRMITPSSLTHPFKPFPQITKSQVIQDQPDRLLVKLVTDGRFTADDQTNLHSELLQRVGGELRIEFQFCEDIPRERSGKYRFVISHVESPARVDWS